MSKVTHLVRDMADAKARSPGHTPRLHSLPHHSLLFPEGWGPGRHGWRIAGSKMVGVRLLA